LRQYDTSYLFSHNSQKTSNFILFSSLKEFMATKNKMKKFMKDGGRLFLPSLSIDCIIFGFHDNHLKVLLLKLKHMDKWALPGGFILKQEDTAAAASRVLKERTGIDKLFLQQFSIFGEPNRSDKSIHLYNLKKDRIEVNKKHWILQRFVTIGYYALVEFSHVNPHADEFSESCEWWELTELPSLMMDHRQILEAALEALRLHLNYHPVGYNLLPEVFTMPQLQRLYETILGKKLDRRNFQRRMLGYGILKKLKERRQGAAHKNPFLYSFDLNKYHKALAEGLKGGW
jgi:8-oxo-dGTP diphosphatase